MKKVISKVWTFGIVLGVAFSEEKKGDVFVGVAEVSDDDLGKFLNGDGSVKDGFEIEGHESPLEQKAKAEAEAKAKAEAELKAKQEAEAKAKAEAEAKAKGK
jgi:hypothetical protein